ncbi:glycerophosphodiester phosphodiesterase [Allohahella marinimesophila]|uniref:GP-PDE domain-containing protein n=1 Tax=Allohahella marinimesophila TaxID=1054972 RepID=A0ABP7PAH4_9GAMM
MTGAKPWRKRMIAALMFIIFIVAAKVLIDWRYEVAVSQARSLFDGCRKAWAHRGFVGEHEENTLGSVRAAAAMGATGVEVDILYDEPTEQFIVSHDEPYQRTDGELLTLDQLLAEFPQDTYLWLDAKNLGELWPQDALAAVAKLAMAIKSYGLQDRALVESRNPLYLGRLSDESIHTSYMISPNAKYAAPLFWLNVYFMKMTYTWGPFSALSMNDYRYGEKVAEAFGDEVAILVSTVNDESEFERYALHPNIRVVLTDKDFFAFDSCSVAVD